MSLRTKVVVAVLVGVLLAGSVGAWVVDSAYRDSTELVARRELEQLSEAFSVLQESETETLLAATALVAADPRVNDLIVDGDRNGLASISLDTYQELNREFGITHWYYEERPADGGRVILRVHQPERFGDRLQRLTYQQAVTDGTGSGLELGRTAFALRAVRRVTDDHGEVIGYVELGKEISHFLDRLKAVHGNDYDLVVSKRCLGIGAERDWEQVRSVYPESGEWDSDPANLLVDSTDAQRDPWSGDIESLPDEGSVIGTTWNGGVAVATIAFPVDDAAGERIGAVLARVDVSELYDRARAAQLKVLLGMGGIMVVLGISLTWYLDRLMAGQGI